MLHKILADWDFYPRSPCGERLLRMRAGLTFQNFYPRSPCGERQAQDGYKDTVTEISIHALLAESDHPEPDRCPCHSHFYPRSPCGERLFKGDHGHISGEISIHALLAESDCTCPSNAWRSAKFLSTLSLRRATIRGPQACACGRDFYPRSPCGERPLAKVRHCEGYVFLSTLSLRRATIMGGPGTMISPFLSTLSLRRATYGRINDISRLIFLSTLSLRRATGRHQEQHGVLGISIHALLAESDPIACPLSAADHNFYPRSPCGERRAQSAKLCHLTNFYPRSPCGERLC